MTELSLKKQLTLLGKLLGVKSTLRAKVNGDAPDYLVFIATTIRSFSPSIVFKLKRPIKKLDRAFRVGSCGSTSEIYISDWEKVFRLTPPSNKKVNQKAYFEADPVSQHAVCRHDAANICIDAYGNIVFREASSFSKENIMMIVPGKPSAKRIYSYASKDVDRALFADGYSRGKLPKETVVLMKLGNKSIVRLSYGKAGGKIKTVIYKKFSEAMPGGTDFAVSNAAHTVLYMLVPDFDEVSVALWAVALGKSPTKDECKVTKIHNWNEAESAKLQYCMSYIRSIDALVICVNGRFSIVGESKSGGEIEYSIAEDIAHCGFVPFDIAEHPKLSHVIVAVDGVIKNPHLFAMDIL